MRLTSRTAADPVPKAFGCRQAFLEFVNVFSHVKEALVGLPNTRKCIEKGVREVVDDTLRLLWSRWMRDMLVHYNVLADNEHINFLQEIIGEPILSTRKRLGQGCCAEG